MSFGDRDGRVAAPRTRDEPITTGDHAGWHIGQRTASRADLPLLADVDVAVVGGGPAGVAAAVTAAELGLTVALIERYGFCGGAAVAGMSGTICGMYLASDDPQAQPVQVVRGFTERFRAALDARGGLTPPQRYGKTWTVTHDPYMWREVADDLLERAGVQVLFHTAVIGVLGEQDRLDGLVLESNAGQTVMTARRIIDASGDAAVVARGGFGFDYGDHGVIQNPTMFFRLAGVDVDRFRASWGDDTICPPSATAAIVAAAADGGLDLPRSKIWAFPSPRPGLLMVNATRLTGRDGRVLNVIDPTDFTEAEIDGRRQVRAYEQFFREHIAGCEHAFLVDTGVEVGIRQTRTIRGAGQLTNGDVVAARKRADSICRSPWPIELHSGDRPKLQWILDDYYDVPYAALVPEQAENVIVAGRSLSAEHEALASARVTAQCFEYGHAAGVAAHLSLTSQVRFRDLAGEQVAEVMRSRGSLL
ncbi:MAG: FAD-dependent oxidoreductase [Microbacterium sp.]|uniref:FAD-dependent oxidoreductase n=1 Tax=Microbacterium sp. TaxID=51671 RepID=UPI003F800DDC